VNQIPISSLVTKEGDLVSLAALRGALRALPIPLDPGTSAGSLTVYRQDLSISVAAKVGVGSIFASSVQANECGFWLDAMAFADSANISSPDNIVRQTRWGYGLRIMFRARQLDSSFKLNIAVLGAALDFGLASACYEVQTIGLGPTALAAVLGGISQFGTLRGDTFHDLNSTVIQNVRKLIADNPNMLDPRPFSVQLSIPIELDPILKAQSEVFAMRRIREGSSIKDTLARAAGRYDVDAIRAVYQKVAPGLQEMDRPPDSARAFAKEWMG
jgi:hypothetical protein